MASKFKAVDDHGNMQTVFILSEYIDAGDTDDPNAIIEGHKTLTTADGKHVNRISKGVYKIETTELTLRSSDPDAP